MSRTLQRREFLSAASLTALTALAGLDDARAGAQLGKQADQVWPPLGPETPFSFDWLTGVAEKRAASAFEPRTISAPDVLAKINYDQYQKIRTRLDRVIDIGGDRRLPMSPFHLGSHAREAVKIHFIEGNTARELTYAPDLFRIPDDHPARLLTSDAGFAGFRILEPTLNSDWFAAMGASYFRSSAPFNQYGISARGLAIDTALESGEEFPSFIAFWLGRPEGSASPVVDIYALLDGPSVAGAYRIQLDRTPGGGGTSPLTMEIEARLFARKPVKRLGIAPFSSMFWYGENNRKRAVDWRPEIHDSDGLAIWNGAGERLWRPITNPPRVMTNAFNDRDPRGFGLMQRDREVGHYRDDAVFYERRPSVWVEPIGAWGEGEVQLVEIPTDDETFDNIVAYWMPRTQLVPGAPQTWRYRLNWCDDVKLDHQLARCVATWTGLGGRPAFKRPDGVTKFVVDFVGDGLRPLDRDAGVSWQFSASRGDISNVYCHPVVGQLGRWRAFADLYAVGDDPVDLRGDLTLKGAKLSETWIYQFFPGTP